MQIKFYSGFRKRINSTKQPSTATVTLSGTLKEECSIETPVILLENLTPNVLPGYVYAYIPDFSRYYFVSGWTYSPPYWECSLNEDYLASWKSYIGNTNAYIDRCASESDGDLIDSQYITKATVQSSLTALDSEYYFLSNITGCYVVGIINGESSYSSQLGGSVTYYVMDESEIRALMAYLLSSNFLNAVGFPDIQTITQQLSQEVAKAFINPFNFIVSVMWYPFPVSKFATGSDVAIKVGYWEIATNIATGKLLTNNMASFSVTGTLPNHPQAATRGNYLNFAPYSRMNVTIPPFGTFPLDLSFRNLGNALRCETYLDVISGKAELFVHIYDGGPIYVSQSTVAHELTAQMGVPIQISQISADYIGALQNVIQGAGAAIVGGASGFLTGGPAGAVFGAVESAFPSIVNAVSCMSPQVSSKGVDGCTIYPHIKPRITSQFMMLVDEDNTELGRPLRQIRQISNLSGFVKCFEVSIDFPCLDSEKTTIYGHMMNGFFYE
ncbi:MAG: hypothetical protein J6Y47_06080 [Bacteroidales bacterium]|nr:hypothetical protein [Bacteroidales bacterium]